MESSAIAKYLSIVVPVYDEEKTAGPVLVDIIETVSSLGISFEVIAVDDGSKDGSLAVLQDVQRQHPQHLRIVQHIYNRGYGSALRTGIRCATGEVVLLMDADGQHQAKEIPILLQHVPPYDLVVGFRTREYQGVWYRNFGNRFYNAFASWLANFKIPDLTSGFRLMRRSAVLHFLHLYPTGFSASLTSTLVFLKAGYNVLFVPVEVQPRTGGKSKVNLLKDGSRFFELLLRMIMLYEPMRIFTPASLFLLVMGVLVMLAGIWDEMRIFVSNAAIFFYSSGIFVFLMGLIANQIVSGRIAYHGDETIREYLPGEKNVEYKHQ